MDPRVSVIVPLYNTEQFVDACLESLMNQTFKDFEAICIDDCSGDDTLGVARDTVGADERFVFIEQPQNLGQSAARNAGIKAASGDYLVFLDSDDYYEPFALEKMVEAVQSNDLDLLFFTAHTFYESRELNRTHPETQDNRRDIDGVHSGEDLYIAFEQADSFRPSACMFMIKAAYLSSLGVGFTEGIIHEDLLFTLCVLPPARRAMFLNIVLYQRRMRYGSTMTSERGMKNVAGMFRVAQGVQAWLEQNNAAYSDTFVDLYTRRLYDSWDMMSRDVNRVTPAEIAAFRDTLTRDERIAFDLHAVWPGEYIDRVYHELQDSLTFRAGRVIMAIPSWIKSRVVLPK